MTDHPPSSASGPSETGDRAQIVSRLRSINPEFVSDWRVFNAAADLLTAQAAKLEAAHADAMIAHRWFAAQFGEVMNGRDFSVKCEMADEFIAAQAAKLEAIRDVPARLRAACYEGHVEVERIADELEAALSSASARPAGPNDASR